MPHLARPMQSPALQNKSPALQNTSPALQNTRHIIHHLHRKLKYRQREQTRLLLHTGTLKVDSKGQRQGGRGGTWAHPESHASCIRERRMVALNTGQVSQDHGSCHTQGEALVCRPLVHQARLFGPPPALRASRSAKRSWWKGPRKWKLLLRVPPPGAQVQQAMPQRYQTPSHMDGKAARVLRPRLLKLQEETCLPFISEPNQLLGPVCGGSIHPLQPPIGMVLFASCGGRISSTPQDWSPPHSDAHMPKQKLVCVPDGACARTADTHFPLAEGLLE